MIEIPQSVMDAYNEPHRKYHNREHIESILAKIPMFQDAYGFDDYRVHMLTAIAWYHDAVYVPGSDHNEEDSMELWFEHCPDSSILKGAIGTAILDTETHSNPYSFWSAIFMDLDLADMGTDAYVENSYKIREEFKDFSDLQWLAGRKKFLHDFLARPFIYHTSLGYKLWEDKARLNMEKELSFLEGKYGGH